MDLLKIIGFYISNWFVNGYSSWLFGNWAIQLLANVVIPLVMVAIYVRLLSWLSERFNHFVDQFNNPT